MGPNETENESSNVSVPRSTLINLFNKKEFVCGWGAAFINITCTFPMNKVMFRQMLYGVSSAKAVAQLKGEGLRILYRGIVPPLFQKTLSTSIMFGMYDQYRGMISKTFPSAPKGVCIGGAAALAGTTEALLCPFERVQTLMQDKTFHNKYRNTYHCLKELNVFGMKEFYRGFSLIIFRNAVSNILFFGLRAPIKNKLTKGEHMSWWEEMTANFISGAVLGACISTIMYPVNVLKTHQQIRIGKSFLSVRDTIKSVYSVRGFNIFHGIHINYTRALVSWGIINASYEMLLKVLYP